MKLPSFFRAFATPDRSIDETPTGDSRLVRINSSTSEDRAATLKKVRPPIFRRVASYLSEESAYTCSSNDSWRDPLPTPPPSLEVTPQPRFPIFPIEDPVPPTTPSSTTTTIVKPKLPPFLRSSSYRSEKSFKSADLGQTSTSIGDKSPVEKTLILRDEKIEVSLLPLCDADSAIYTSVSPSLADSAEEGLAFEGFSSGNDSLRVIVIGTGFAGLSTAIACARAGFAVTILERSSGKSAHGDSVLLGPNAGVLLHRWGIASEMWKRSSRANWWYLLDKQGRQVHQEDLRGLPEKYGAPMLQGKRSHFIGAMGTEARLLGVKFRYETEVTGFTDSSESPGAIIKGGEIVRGDLVVICDGARSASRVLLSSLDNPPPPRRASGYSIYRAILNADALREDPTCRHLVDGNIRFWLGLDSHVELWAMDGGKQIAFTFTRPDPNASSTLSWRSVTPISTVLAELSDWDPVLQAAIRKFPKALNWTILEDSVYPGWISAGGKIVFAGDAIHPLSPASFQGATQAIEDGATIAMCLSLAGGVPERVGIALKAFELLRRGRTERAGRLGRKQQRIFHTYVSRTAGGSRPLSPKSTSRSPEFAPQPDVLRPLSFELFDFDAEQYVRDNFAKVVRFIDRSRRGSIIPPEEVFSSYGDDSD